MEPSTMTIYTVLTSNTDHSTWIRQEDKFKRRKEEMKTYFTFIIMEKGGQFLNPINFGQNTQPADTDNYCSF